MPVVFLSAMEEGRAHPACINSSNSYHECVNYCFRKIYEAKERREIQEQLPTFSLLRISEQIPKIKPHGTIDYPDCINSSNPWHTCVDFCFRKILEVKEQREQEEQVLVTEQAPKVDPSCRNSLNPSHQCSFFCFRRIREEHFTKYGRPVRIVVEAQRQTTSKLIAAASKEREERERKVVAEKEKRKQQEEEKLVAEKERRKQEEEKERILRAKKLEKQVHPDCINSSSPYHDCAYFCVQKIAEAKEKKEQDEKRISEAKKKRERDEQWRQKVEPVIRAHKQDIRVHPDCVSSSDPYHECSHFCLQKVAAKKRRDKEVQKREQEEQREREEQASKGGNTLDAQEIKQEPVGTEDLNDGIDMEWEIIDMTPMI